MRFHNSRNLSTKPLKNAQVDDRWLAGVGVKTLNYRTAQGARSFKAFNLNLFHMALLANVAHSEYPLYSLFKNKCYWFSNIIYLAARIIDRILASRPDLPYDPEDPRKIKDDFFSSDLYICLRWQGVG